MKRFFQYLIIFWIPPLFAFEDNENAIGFWFYKDEIIEEKDEQTRKKLPPAPSLNEMMKMHPKDLEQLQLEYLDQSVWLLTPDSVLDEMKIRDAIRRKRYGN